MGSQLYREAIMRVHGDVHTGLRASSGHCDAGTLPSLYMHDCLKMTTLTVTCASRMLREGYRCCV